MYIIPRRRKLFCSISVEIPIPGGVPGPLHKVIITVGCRLKLIIFLKEPTGLGLEKEKKIDMIDNSDVENMFQKQLRKCFFSYFYRHYYFKLLRIPSKIRKVRQKYGKCGKYVKSPLMSVEVRYDPSKFVKVHNGYDRSADGFRRGMWSPYVFSFVRNKSSHTSHH